MAKADDNEPYTMSGRKLFETRQARDLITSTISLDIGLGGGLPLGATVLLGGRAKSGKTSLSLDMASDAQKKYGCKVFFANIEGRLDNKVLSQSKNLDLDNLEVIMGPAIYDKKEKDKIIGHKKMGSAQWWQKIGTLITDNPRSIIIVDSISALSEDAELASGMGYMSRGGLSKLESQFMRQYGDLIVPNQVTLFLLAQVQANTSGYGEALVIKAGNSIRHAADCIMFIRSVDKWKGTTENARVLGHDINVRIECSPCGPPYINTIIPLRFGDGIDKSLDVGRNAITWDIIKSAGAWYILPFKKDNDKPEIVNVPDDKEEQAEFVKIQGEENLRNWLVANPKHMLKIETIIKEKIFI